MGAGFPQMPGGFNQYPPSYLPGGFSQFNNTGVPGMMGGDAYPPGSSMTGFMDDLNNQVASATRGPNGESVLDWANNLAAGNGQGPVQTPQAPMGVGPTSQAPQSGQPKMGSLSQNPPSGGQLALLLLAEVLEQVLEQVLQKLKGGKGKQAQNQGNAETAFGAQKGFCAQA